MKLQEVNGDQLGQVNQVRTTHNIVADPDLIVSDIAKAKETQGSSEGKSNNSRRQQHEACFVGGRWPSGLLFQKSVSKNSWWLWIWAGIGFIKDIPTYHTNVTYVPRSLPMDVLLTPPFTDNREGMAKKSLNPTMKKIQHLPQLKPNLTSHESQVALKWSALKSARVVAQKPVQDVGNEDKQTYSGIFDERGECRDFEGDHAWNSPKKNGQWADSKASTFFLRSIPTDTGPLGYGQG